MLENKSFTEKNGILIKKGEQQGIASHTLLEKKRVSKMCCIRIRIKIQHLRRKCANSVTGWWEKIKRI